MSYLLLKILPCIKMLLVLNLQLKFLSKMIHKYIVSYKNIISQFKDKRNKRNRHLYLKFYHYYRIKFHILNQHHKHKGNQYIQLRLQRLNMCLKYNFNLHSLNFYNKLLLLVIKPSSFLNNMQHLMKKDLMVHYIYLLLKVLVNRSYLLEITSKYCFQD